LVFSQDKVSITLKPGSLIPVFCADCPAQVQQDLENHLFAEAFKPIIDPVTLTKERYGRIRKFVIATLDDRAITITLQRTMIKNNIRSIRQVFELKAGHLPFLSQPKKVAQILERI